MNILWLCNTILPEIAVSLNRPVSHTGGWLVGLSQALCKSSEINRVTIVFPQSFSQETVCGESEHFTYFGFYRRNDDLTSCKEERIGGFQKILEDEKPDVVHIFGSEFISCYEMTRAAERAGLLGRTVISIQGLIGECGNVYEADLPAQVLKHRSLRDMLKNDGIQKQKEIFLQRGIYEQKALAMVSHVIGRTDWDRSCAMKYHPQVRYHHCGETLRASFASLNWSYESCTKHTLFLSQGYYPIKGLHKVLDAMEILLKEYPGTRIRVTGRDILHLTWKDALKLSSYQAYLRKRIHQLGLEDKITFLGALNEEAMGKEYLNANVFVSPSSIENSSNSIGEAQMVGMPIVASNVGGTASILTDGEDGLLYPFEDAAAMAERILRIFKMEERSEEMGRKGKEKAALLYSSERNNEELLQIYREIVQNK